MVADRPVAASCSDADLPPLNGPPDVPGFFCSRWSWIFRSPPRSPPQTDRVGHLFSRLRVATAPPLDLLGATPPFPRAGVLSMLLILTRLNWVAKS